MNQEKTKKRGRPAQLLQVAELSAFVDFLKAKKECSELQNQVIEALQQHDFTFGLLSEAQQILVKEALKPYREHTKLSILAEQLRFEPNHSEYEMKFLQLYQDYEKGVLDQTHLNLLKTMCTRYLSFKAQKLKASDLELYLSQIQKKEAQKKRSAENQRKFEVGGGVLGLYKFKNEETMAIDKILRRIQIDRYFAGKLRQTQIYRKVWGMDLTNKERSELLFEVFNQLILFQYSASGTSILDRAIQNAEKKLKQEKQD